MNKFLVRLSSLDKDQASTSDGHFLYLDLIRGLAAMSVLIYHFGEQRGLSKFYEGSFLAVDLFFLMSGFVIASAYEPKLRSCALSFEKFAFIRLIRLYPLYALSVFIGIIYVLLKKFSSQEVGASLVGVVTAIPAAIVLLPNPFVSVDLPGAFPFSGSAWSLSLELWFNLIYAFVAFRLKAYQLALTAGLALLVLIITSIGHRSLDMGWGWSTLLGGAARFWFSFTLGILLFRLRNKVALPRIPILGPLAVLLTITYVFVGKTDLVLQFTYVVGVFPVSVFYLSEISTPSFLRGISTHLGRLSYGLYILHGPLFLISAAALKLLVHKGLSAFNQIDWSIIAMFIFASVAVSTYLLDEPLRKQLRFKSSKMSSHN